jgi:hypothetical protein
MEALARPASAQGSARPPSSTSSSSLAAANIAAEAAKSAQLQRSTTFEELEDHLLKMDQKIEISRKSSQMQPKSAMPLEAQSPPAKIAVESSANQKSPAITATSTPAPVLASNVKAPQALDSPTPPSMTFNVTKPDTEPISTTLFQAKEELPSMSLKLPKKQTSSMARPESPVVSSEHMKFKRQASDPSKFELGMLLVAKHRYEVPPDEDLPSGQLVAAGDVLKIVEKVDRDWVKVSRLKGSLKSVFVVPVSHLEPISEPEQLTKVRNSSIFICCKFLHSTVLLTIYRSMAE